MQRTAARRRFAPLALVLAAACDAGPLGLPPVPAGAVTVSDVRPLTGFSGDLVTVTGEGFGRDPASVEVLFNGYGARPETVDADGRGLTVRVPAGIQSGAISVSSPDGRGTSTLSFGYLGAGHLERGAVARAVPLRAGLGAIAQVDGELWALASTLQQVVKPGALTVRKRLTLDDAPTALAPMPDAEGRLVCVTRTHVYAGAESSEATRPVFDEELATGAEALFDVVVVRGGTHAIAATPAALYDVDLTLRRPQLSPPLPLPGARLVDLTTDEAGLLVLALALDAGGSALAFADAATPAVRTSHPHAGRFAGATAAFTTAQGRRVAVGLEEGGLALFDADLLAFSDEIDLLAGHAPAGLALAGDLVLATIAERGRLVAVDLARSRVAWTLELGGEPRGIVVDAAGLAHVANASTNRLQVVDPVSRSLLGERRIGVDAGSPLGGRHGLRAISRELVPGVVASGLLLLTRAGEALVAIDGTTATGRPTALLKPEPLAYALSPDQSVAIVAHDDGTLGSVAPGLRPLGREQTVCGAGLPCPALDSPLVLLELPAADTLLVVTRRVAQVRRLPSLSVVASRAAGTGVWVGATLAGSGLALQWADSEVNPRELRFERFDGLASLETPASTSIESALPARQLQPRGLASLRPGPDQPSSPVFLFARVVDGVARPWLFAPDRLVQPLIPSPEVGSSPVFAPDGRQAIGSGAASSLDRGLAYIARGELLDARGMLPQAVVDLGGVSTGLAFAPDGENAFAIIGETDTIVVLE